MGQVCGKKPHFMHLPCSCSSWKNTALQSCIPWLILQESEQVEQGDGALCAMSHYSPWCLVGNGGMDPYSSPYIIPKSSPHNFIPPFPTKHRGVLPLLTPSGVGFGAREGLGLSVWGLSRPLRPQTLIKLRGYYSENTV